MICFTFLEASVLEAGFELLKKGLLPDLDFGLVV
jgi:hypothetical protein